MTRITFLIGNGFDINVGLKTKYSDFYKYYVERNKDDMLAKAIDANYEFWSDLEVGLGKFTSEISSDEEKLFWESEDILESSLADYLETEMQRIQISEDMKSKIAIKMKKSLLQFYDGFPKEQQQFLNNVIYSVRDSIVYSFISYNYTNALDRCIQLIKEKFPQEIGGHKADNGNYYTHSVGNVMHIHGTTDEELVLGVNDAGQITNESFRKNEFYRQCLIKLETNKRFRQNKIEDTRRMIDSSVIICIFGMSLGATDKIWWEYICQWLNKSDNHRLIIFVKNDKSERRVTKQQLFLTQNEVISNLKINSGMKDDQWDKIVGKVFIKINSDIFDFKLTND